MKETEFIIILETIKKVQDFNKIVSKYEEEITLKSHRYEIDAKSIMGIFSLNLLEHVRICLYSDDEEVISRFTNDMEQFKYVEENA